jgi:peptidoglycan/xylan/chitin deacetylase (PgdA/CDA1 family)
MKRSVPILLYHHVAPDREISPERFAEQMRSLVERGYESLSMDDLVQVAQGHENIQKPAFVLAFDDGYRDNWEHAFPIIKKWGIQAVIYLVTERVGSDGFLSWDEVKSMSDSGLVIFGSHTHTHRHFVRKEPYGNLEDELRTSKSVLETRLGKPCRHMAWPWGDYEDAWLPLVQKLGYVSAATTLAGANAKGTNPYEFRRINVRHSGVRWLGARLRWNAFALLASTFGLFYGWDRRFKVWWNNESPYPHG